jgi:hypothetical protein
MADTAGLLAPLAGTGLALAAPLLGAVAVVLGAGAMRRLALRLALRSAWQENKLALIVLKFLGGKAPRLDEFEHGLPSLPVPPLAATMRRWLQSLEPILDAAAMQRASASAADFEASDEGKKLQRLLEKRAISSRNWLSEWWEEFAYLRGRLPLPTYANFFCTDRFRV